jgi:hypothetical protein
VVIDSEETALSSLKEDGAVFFAIYVSSWRIMVGGFSFSFQESGLWKLML